MKNPGAARVESLRHDGETRSNALVPKRDVAELAIQDIAQWLSVKLGSEQPQAK